MAATQSKYPWRAVARTVFAVIVGTAAMAPAVYSAATNHDPTAATGWAATGLGIAAAITRVLALPQVNSLLGKVLPFLAAEPKDAVEVPPVNEEGDAEGL